MGSLLAFLPRIAAALPQLVRILPAIVQFLPMVMEVVRAVEKLIGAGNGGVKKALVVDIVKLAIVISEKASGKDLVEDEDALANAIGEIVEFVVQTLKKSGGL